MKTHLIQRRPIAILVFLLLKLNLAANGSRTYTFTNPCQPFATIVAIDDSPGCYSFSVTNGGAGDPNAFYSWQFGDGATAIGTHVIHCYKPVVNTTVRSLTVAYNSPALCGVQPNQSVYTITLNPASATDCTPSPGYSVSAAKSVTVWGSVAIPEIITSYDYGDGSPVTNNYTHEYDSCGSYIIKVKRWDMNNPSDYCNSFISVNFSCSLSPTPTDLDIHRYNIGKINIVPNPAHEFFKIDTEEIVKSVTVTDVCGKVVLDESTAANRHEAYKIADLSPGVYLVKVRFADSNEKSMKFIKY